MTPHVLGVSSVVGNGEIRLGSAFFRKSRTVFRSVSTACARQGVVVFDEVVDVIRPEGSPTATRVNSGGLKTSLVAVHVGRALDGRAP